MPSLRASSVFCLVMLGFACSRDDASGEGEGCGIGFESKDGTCVRCDPFSAPAEGGGCATVGLLPEHCASGFAYDAERHTCEPVLPAGECAAGTIPVLGSTECRPVGVETCAAGFSSDHTGGCTPVLPKSRCSDGELALPGESSCHVVSSCGSGTFGDIPVGAGTVFVDASYAGGASDGSQARPFTTVQAGIDAAGLSALVAVAAGTYEEDVSIARAVRLVGRCPGMVTVRGKKGGDVPTFSVRPNGAVTVSGLAITGPGPGLAAGGAVVTVEKVWVHDTGGRGINALYTTPLTQLNVRDSLVERATEVGVMVYGAKATIERVAVRKTNPVSGKWGRGITIDSNDAAKRASEVTIRLAVVEDTHENAIVVFGSRLTLERSVVRDTAPRVAGSILGVGVYAESIGKLVADVSVTDTVIEASTTSGVALLGAKASIERSTIRDKGSPADKLQGYGVAAQPRESPPLPSEVTIRASAITRNRTAGLFLVSSTALVEGTILRDGLPEPKTGAAGFGISLQQREGLDARTTLTLRGSLIDNNLEAGIAVFGSQATIEGSVIRGTRPRTSDRLIGRGIDTSVMFGQAPELHVSSSIIERNEETGIALHGGTATLDGVLVRDTTPRTPTIDKLGYGVSAIIDPDVGMRPTLDIKSSLFERNHGVGIAFASADGSVFGTVVRDTYPTVGGDEYGVGIVAAANPGGSGPSVVRVERCLLDGNRYGGFNVNSSEGTFIASISRGTHADAEALFGDGVGVDTFEEAFPGTLVVSRSILSGNARAGLTTFGSKLSVEGSMLTCNGFDIDAETRPIGAASLEPTIEDRGQNVCGCGATWGGCHAQSHSFAPSAPPVVPSR